MKRYEKLKSENSNYYWLYKKYWKILHKDQSKLSHKIIKIKKSNMQLSFRQIIDYMLSFDDTLKLAYEFKKKA